MRLKATLVLAALALVLAAPGFGQEAPGTLSMSLEECIIKALKDNLGVAIQVLGPQISAQSVNLAQNVYIPTLSLSARSQKAESAAYSYLDSPGAATINRTQNYNFLNVNESLPTGGSLSLGFTGYRTTTNTQRHHDRSPLRNDHVVQSHPAPAQELRSQDQPPGDPDRPEQPGCVGREPQGHADDHGLQRRERLLEPGLQHREPRRAAPIPQAGPGPPREEPALGRGRHARADRGPQRPGRSGHPRGRPHPGRDPDQEQRGPAEAPAPHHRGRGQGHDRASSPRTSRPMSRARSTWKRPWPRPSRTARN